MNKKTYSKLEFNQICKIISDFAITSSGKNLAININELPKSEITKSYNQVSEAVSLLYKIGKPPILVINDISITLKTLTSQNTLSIPQLLDLLNILEISQELKNYFFVDYIDISSYKLLNNLFSNLYSNPSIIKTLSNSITDENTLDDSASLNLRNIRNNIRQKENEIQQKLSNLLHSKFVQEPIITIRNDRYVIPIKSECRNEIRGFIHDISTSGATSFIEPLSIFEINNQITSLKNEENIEINKILKNLSSLFYDIIDNISNTFNLIGLLDFIFAKAEFSKLYNCSAPIINEDKFINLINCYHPLLNTPNIVKNDIYLGKDFNTLIITGPNTGGKTILLKTIGIICLMAKCGLHIPAKQGSSIYLYDKIFVDIGDDQSIIDSLSTFSSHIINITNIIQNLTENSLVLIDELGSGTDPIEGSALAISIIEYLNSRNISSVITTHYHEVKMFAINSKQIENASVLFDINSLTPTYKLLIGIPGESNAFVISQKLGLPENIINNAKKYVNKDTINIEKELNEIHKNKTLIEKEKNEIDIKLQEITNLRNELEISKHNLNQNIQTTINNAKLEAQEILRSAKNDANEIIKELENTQNISKANILRKNINSKIQENNQAKNTSKEYKKLTLDELKIGYNVYIPSLEKNGIIISKPSRNNTVQVQVENVRTYFNISDLTFSKNTNNKPEIISKQKKDFKISSISPEINVIGQNVEDACLIIDKYMDTCVLKGLYNIRIVHGKGTGTLRNGIHKFLKNHPHVESYRIGVFGEGEMGVTIVELK